MQKHKQENSHNVIKFTNCIFTKNVNMEAIIYITPPTKYMSIGYISISKSTFYKNKNTNFIKVKKESRDILYVTTYLILHSVNISCNEHDDGDNLILISNGRIWFLKSVFFNQNGYYENIINLQSSLLMFRQYTEISSNHARHIVKAQGNSFLFMQAFTTVNISHNIVYKTIKQVSALEKHTVHICPLQSFYTQCKVLHNQMNLRLLLLHNTEMTSKILPTEIISYVNKECTWLEDTCFQKMNINVSAVYHKIVYYSNTFVNKTTKNRLIPLNVCPCLNNSRYNCYEAPVYSVFPGQLLYIKLIVSPRWSDIFSTIVAANTIDDDCSIVDGYQLSQTHLNNGCNRYSYTIWPNNESITECKLLIGLSEMPEMFYVEIKPCPMGFTLKGSMKACYCDPLLNNDKVSITSCNINDGTIQRPANSWIFAETVNMSHSYDISPQCPFDYCLPHSSHLNLSDPDSQCQYKRTGQGRSQEFSFTEARLKGKGASNAGVWGPPRS